MAVRRPDDAGSRASLEGRLDLDALDDGHDLLDLDVIDQDRPGLGESLADWSRRHGLTDLVARHRTAAVALGVVAVLLLASAGVWWVRRPVPLPPPQVLAQVSGAEPTASLVPGRSSGAYAVQQTLRITSDEAPGVAVRVLGLSGPGLSTDHREPAVDVGAQDAGRPLVVGAELACASPEATTAAVSSKDSDYGLVLQRTSPSGEVRVDRVPIVGDATLVDQVHQGCLQIAADRDLVVNSVTPAPVEGMAVVRLDVGLFNSSPRVWTGLHIAASAQPFVVNDGRQVALEPGTSGHLKAQFWPEDCADPMGALRQGVPVAADLGPTGLSPSQATSSSVLLRLPGSMVDEIAKVAVAACGTNPPRGTVTWARLREGGSNGTGGVIDLGLSFTAPGAGIVEVDHLGDGSPQEGELFAYQTPVHTVDGVATVKAQWRLPACPVILRDGLPRMHVVIGDGVRRPYLLPLSGEPLRPVLVRLCGSEVADLLG